MNVLTVEEAAAVLKISPYTVRELLKVGELPGRKIGRQWRIRTFDLQAFVEGKATTIEQVTPAGNEAVAKGVAASDPYGTARLSEDALAKDWLTPEEDDRWAHL